MLVEFGGPGRSLFLEEVMDVGLNDGFLPQGWKWNRGGREW